MFADEEGEPIASTAMPGSTVTLPDTWVWAFNVDAAIDKAVQEHCWPKLGAVTGLPALSPM